MEMKIKDDKLLYLLKIYPIKYDDFFSMAFDETKKEVNIKQFELKILILHFYSQIIT